MKIDYDRSVDIKYVTFYKGKVVRSEPVEDWLIFDYAKDGRVIGIEILDASEHRDIGIYTIAGEFCGYSVRKSGSEVKGSPEIRVPDKLISGFNIEPVAA